MLLTRKRIYYLLRELECVSCRRQVGTRLFVDGKRVVADELDVGDGACIEAFCIYCAHKAPTYKQTSGRKDHVDEAIKLMYLREAAKIPTRYDAYRDAQKAPLGQSDVYEIVKRLPCEVCGKKHYERLLRWPDHKNQQWHDTYGLIDQFRDLVYLCKSHREDPILLSESFDENFYKEMRALYYT